MLKHKEKFFYRDLPNNKSLYEGTYWGNFEYDPEKKSELDIIIKNRNSFEIDFNITKYIGNERPKKDTVLKFDHCELYKCEDGFIYITSPYGSNDKAAEEIGFEKYISLYAPNATTYLRKFASKYEFNKFIKST